MDHALGPFEGHGMGIACRNEAVNSLPHLPRVGGAQPVQSAPRKDADVELDRGFYEASHGIRYTLSQAARTEFLDRLLELNHQRYAEKVATGLHDKKVAKGKVRDKTQAAQRELALAGGEDV